MLKDEGVGAPWNHEILDLGFPVIAPAHYRSPVLMYNVALRGYHLFQFNGKSKGTFKNSTESKIPEIITSAPKKEMDTFLSFSY